MGSGGHNAKTKSQHERDGTLNVTRHRDRIDFPKLKDAPKPPAYFTEGQAAKWSAICAMLKRDGMLSDTFLELVERYCNAWQMWNEARTNVVEKGLTYKSNTGNPHANPAVNIEKEMLTLMVRILNEFGYTPRSSMSIKTPQNPADDGDPLTAIFGKN